MMENKNIKVLHIDSEKSWRGGQQQAAYLLERMHALGSKTAMVCKPGSAMETYCQGKGLPVYGIPMHGELDITAGYKIASLCRKQGFHILHLHSAHALATGLWASLFYKKLRLIAVRRVSVPIKKNWFSRFKYLTPRLNRIVCISNAIKAILMNDGLHGEKLTVIHSGVHLDKFKGALDGKLVKQTLGIPDDHLVVGTIAAFTREKGYPTLLKAAEEIVRKHERVTFCAVGSGAEEEAIHTMAKDLRLGDRMIFTGFRKDVGSLLNMFDLFVLPSYQEGLGSSILDAQALGLPVVACRTGGVPEIVHHGVNGLLVPPRDSKALVLALEDLVCNSEKRKQFGLKAMETVQAFSIDRTVENNMALYRQLGDGTP
ncbi:MAG: glycosyltransferase family 4 protein [Proteobacteria bacterium]|nr:glycosyltransferase family 4 protein [Pseudomonadota bacterium]